MTDDTHEHSIATCAHDTEGPTVWWLCGHDPRSTPRPNYVPRCAVCGGLNPGDPSHVRCM